MNTSMPPTTDTHQPWCDTEDACAGRSESGTHWGRRHVMTWDGETPGRNRPELAELGVRAALHEGRHPILDIEVDPATSGCDEVLWLTPAEGRRFAAAILAAADELDDETTPLPMQSAGQALTELATVVASSLTVDERLQVLELVTELAKRVLQVDDL